MNWRYLLNPWHEVRIMRRQLRRSTEVVGEVQMELDHYRMISGVLRTALNARRKQVHELEALVRKAAEATDFEGDFGPNYVNLANWLDIVSCPPPKEAHGDPVQSRVR